MNELEIFENAYAIDDPAERIRYLDEVCGADKQLRQRMDLLLSAPAAAHDFLSVPARKLIESEQTIDAEENICMETAELSTQHPNTAVQASAKDSSPELAFLQPQRWAILSGH